MTLSDIREERIGQVSAIERNLATAPKIQEDLKRKFGEGENIFFYNDLTEYRLTNSRLDIAEDLDVKSRHGIKKNDVARTSVGSAFRGHHHEEFMPDYQFNGLFSEEMNDMIEGIRYEKGGQKTYEQGVGIHAQTLEEKAEAGRKGYANGLANLTPEEKAENARKATEARGQYVWSLEEIAEIGELKYDEGLTWKDTTSEMNEKYGEDWTTRQVTRAYQNNKHLLSDEEE
jgi:hypothetical protein